MRKVTLAIVNIIAIFCITLCITTDAFSKGTFTQYEKEYSLNEILIGKHIVIGLHKHALLYATRYHGLHERNMVYYDLYQKTPIALSYINNICHKMSLSKYKTLNGLYSKATIEFTTIEYTELIDENLKRKLDYPGQSGDFNIAFIKPNPKNTRNTYITSTLNGKKVKFTVSDTAILFLSTARQTLKKGEPPHFLVVLLADLHKKNRYYALTSKLLPCPEKEKNIDPTPALMEFLHKNNLTLNKQVCKTIIHDIVDRYLLIRFMCNYFDFKREHPHSTDYDYYELLYGPLD